MSRQSPRAVFSRIYKQAQWGTVGGERYSSGWGSHDPSVLGPYIAAVNSFLQATFPELPDVVDLGCGDFNVGARIRPACRRYIACDVVPELIEHNRDRFAALDVDFRCIDMVSESWPEGQIVFIRQVLQHLSNDQIQRIIPKLASFDYVLITEHLPLCEGFTPNIDKGPGVGVRASRIEPSAVVLTEPPFSLQPVSQRLICAVSTKWGRIQTIAYRLC